MFLRQAKLRFTPPAGAAVEYDLSALEYLTIVQPLPSPILLQKEMIDYSIRTRPKGWRIPVIFRYEVGEDNTTDDATFAAIWARLGDPLQELEVTLDNGTLWRKAHLTEWSSEPMEEKNIGRIYGFTIVCEKVLTPDLIGASETRTAPPVMTGW